jgi:anti-sigma B factor antagonist
MEINKTLENGKAEMKISGRIDTVSSPLLEQELNEILPQTDEIVLDFEDVEYISSAGLRILLVLTKLLKAKDGKLKLINVQKVVKDVFEITGFDNIFNIEE